VNEDGQRVRLSVGFERSRGVRLAVTTLAGLLAAFGAGCVGLIAGMMLVWLVDDAGSGWASLPFGLAAVFAVAVLVLAALGVARIVRFGAWLDGNRLTVRNVRARTADLAGARSVAIRSTRSPLAGAPAGVDPVVRMLDVTTDQGLVQLRLASLERVLLPPNQLLALADAVAAARCPGAAEVVGWLRSAAAQPRLG
jgi:hypothetical protein